MLNQRLMAAGSLAGIDKSIAHANNTVLFVTVAFLLSIALVVSVSVIFRKQLRKAMNMNIVMPIVGLLLLVIPFAEDYINLVVHGEIKTLFGSYLQSGNAITKLSIYFVAFGFILRSKNMISAITPLIFVSLTMSVITGEINFYAFNVMEYAMVISTVLFFHVVTKKRYSTINFIDSLLIYGVFASVIITSKIMSAHDLDGIANVKVNTFNLFGSVGGGWDQVIVWSLIVVSTQFLYLFLSTKYVFKFNVKETFSLIRLEDKYRKANIEIELHKDDYLSIRNELLNETDSIDLTTDVLFVDEVREVEDDFSSRLQRIFVKSKGIRSPSFL